MLDRMSPEQFNERFAAWIVSGEGDSQHYVARLLAAIGNLIPSYAAVKGAADVPHRKIEDYLPTFLKPKKRREQTLTGDEIAKRLGCIK